jgi:hypothetical protein
MDKYALYVEFLKTLEKDYKGFFGGRFTYDHAEKVTGYSKNMLIRIYKKDGRVMPDKMILLKKVYDLLDKRQKEKFFKEIFFKKKD